MPAAGHFWGFVFFVSHLGQYLCQKSTSRPRQHFEKPKKTNKREALLQKTRFPNSNQAKDKSRRGWPALGAPRSRETMVGLRLMLVSPVIYLLPLLVISSQAHLTSEIIMQKEMDWAKTSMEKHHKSKGHLPLRHKVSRGKLYPEPDVDYSEDESIDEDSLSADVDLNYVTLLLEPDKASNNLRRRSILGDETQNRTRMESLDY
jgi:hypothetical protein